MGNNLPSPSTINVKVVTYRMKWDNTKSQEESSEERTFNSLDELKSFTTEISQINEKYHRDAKKNKLSYYLAQFIETV